MNTGCQFKHLDADGNELPKISKLSLKSTASSNGTVPSTINGGLQPSLLPRPPSSTGSSTPTSSSSSANPGDSAKKRYNFSKVSSFVPSNSGQSPVMSSANLVASTTQPNSTAKNVSAAPFTPTGEFEQQSGYMDSPVLNSPYLSMSADPQTHHGLFVPQQAQTQPQQAPQPNLSEIHNSFALSLQPQHPNSAPPGTHTGPPTGPPQGEFFFHPHSNPAQMQNPFTVLNYHLYSPAPPPNNSVRLHGNAENAETMFIPSKLREKLNRKNEATLKSFPGGWQNLIVSNYFDLVPLDTITQQPAQIDKETDPYCGFKSTLFKCISNNDGRYYALRRLENIGNEIAEKNFSAVIPWKNMKHQANITRLIDAFTTRAFNDHSLVLIYEFYPNSKTLDEYHRNPKTGVAFPITEALLWTYLVQLSSGLSVAHEANLAVRSISLKKVILTSDNRVRFSDCVISDILNYDNEETPEKMKALQIKDLEKLGRLILSLAKYKDGIISPCTETTLESDLRYIDSSTTLKEDFKNALKYLLIPSQDKSVFEFHKSISSRLIKELNNIQSSADFYESQLTREVENARLVRLLTKLNFVIHRQNPNNSFQPWTPTGDKYALTLFHSYVFHQVDAHGKPVLDLSHVLRCLNKLDVGVEEKILLVSEDEQSCLILTYREIKQMIERGYRELCS